MRGLGLGGAAWRLRWLPSSFPKAQRGIHLHGRRAIPRRVHASATVAASPFSCSALCILPVIPAPCSNSECGSSKNDHFRASLAENVHKQVSQLLHLGHCPCSSSVKRGSPPFRIVRHFRHDPRPLQKLQPIGLERLTLQDAEGDAAPPSLATTTTRRV
jgi:hypothetical protein